MPDRNRQRRPEFEVAYYTKELGKTLQREMLQKQLALLGESGRRNVTHGEDAVAEQDPSPPQDHRAG